MFRHPYYLVTEEVGF